MLALLHHGFVNRWACRIRDAVSKDGFVGPWYGALQTYRTLSKQSQMHATFRAAASHAGHLLNAWLTSLFFVEDIGCTFDLAKQPMHIDGKANGSQGVANGP